MAEGRIFRLHKDILADRMRTAKQVLKTPVLQQEQTHQRHQAVRELQLIFPPLSRKKSDNFCGLIKVSLAFCTFFQQSITIDFVHILFSLPYSPSLALSKDTSLTTTKMQLCQLF